MGGGGWGGALQHTVLYSPSDLRFHLPTKLGVAIMVVVTRLVVEKIEFEGLRLRREREAAARVTGARADPYMYALRACVDDGEGRG